MKFITVLSLATASLVLGACSQSVPKCSDKETTDLVRQIADEEMTNQLGAETAKMFSYVVQAIRTTNTNEQTGAHECAAELQVNGNNGQSSTVPITYTVEMTDDGEHFYVNVFGL